MASRHTIRKQRIQFNIPGSPQGGSPPFEETHALQKRANEVYFQAIVPVLDHCFTELEKQLYQHLVERLKIAASQEIAGKQDSKELRRWTDSA